MTWPAYTSYVPPRGSGRLDRQQALWGLVEHDNVVIAEQGPEHRQHMRALVQIYPDHPMGLADASLVVLAEKQSLRHRFTLDEADFRLYRLHQGQTFHLWLREP